MGHMTSEPTEQRTTSGSRRPKSRIGRVLGLLVIMVSGCTTSAPPQEPAAGRTAAEWSTTQSVMPPSDPANGTPIRIVLGDDILHAELWDNATARSLIDQLPLSVNFSDMNREEKVGHLDTALSMDGMPAGDDPQPQDIGWYAPWGNLVFYYGDVGYWNGIARIGRFTDGVATVANQDGDFSAIIELDQ
jgi:hypothetical protein